MKRPEASGWALRRASMMLRPRSGVRRSGLGPREHQAGSRWRVTGVGRAGRTAAGPRPDGAGGVCATSCATVNEHRGACDVVDGVGVAEALGQRGARGGGAHLLVRDEEDALRGGGVGGGRSADVDVVEKVVEAAVWRRRWWRRWTRRWWRRWRRRWRRWWWRRWTRLEAAGLQAVRDGDALCDPLARRLARPQRDLAEVHQVGVLCGGGLQDREGRGEGAISRDLAWKPP